MNNLNHPKPAKPACCSGVSNVFQYNVCPVRDRCLRFTKIRAVGTHNRVPVHQCRKDGQYFFLVESGTEAGKMFTEQLLRISMESTPILFDSESKEPNKYYCRFCRSEGIEHEIVNESTPKGMFSEVNTFWMDRGRSHLRVCTGCRRFDGPWLPYGDD